jgi:uncharacterized protein (PEP-CTERM system associated)
LALAPPHWAVAAPPRATARGGRVAILVAATCGLAAIARAQAPSGGGDSGGGAPAGGGATPGGGAAGGGGAAATAPAAPAPSVSDAAPGSLRAAIENALPGVNVPPAAAAPAWTITPGISLQEEWTDNTFNTANHKSSLITQIAPSIAINGATARLTADLYYAPSVSLYTPESSQNQVAQNLGADALLTLAPEELYIKATGYAAVQSLAAGTAPNGTTALPTSNEVQTYDFSIEPYAMHRFGGWGTLQVGVAASETRSDTLGNGANIQSLTTRQELASFTSGENFGRLSSTLAVSATQDTGTGTLQGASQTVASYQAGYAITHSIIALASIGWEDIRYGGGALTYDDATWSLGVELTPNPDSSITVTYGHQDGATAAAVNASYAPTATIRLSAQYSAGITTAAQALNTALSGATFDANGHPISATTGAPLLANTNFYGFNATVYQSKNLSLSAAWLLPRDAFQAIFSQQTQTPVGNGASTLLAAQGNLVLNQGLAANSGTYGTLSWQHDLRPELASTLSATYGVLNNATPVTLTNGVLTATGKEVQNATQLTVTAGLNWQMSETLTGSLQYTYSSNDYSGGTPGVATNLVILGLRKTF